MNKMNFSLKSRIARIKSTLIFILGLLLSQSIDCVSQKGATPLITPARSAGGHNSSLITSSNTYAVIIGISDYQSPQIPDLKFADRDAQAFAEWLQSKAGGLVPSEHIRLLINEKATRANIIAALDGVTDDCKENDQVIIYFSGHGDIETKRKNQLGFLLSWDSAPTNYKAGAYPLYYLQNNIETISDKKAHVLVIMDACHAGKLAGTSVGGTIATAQSLAQQFANEVKIMSCQPDEFALEGTQWGGGRGVFSYYLIEGLTGFADKNNDKEVNLYEIDRYLEDNVQTQAAPQSQIPMVVGDKKTVLSKVNEAALLALKSNSVNQKNQIHAVEGRGYEEAFLKEPDSIYKKLYIEFNTALDKGELLKPKGHCANDIYEALSKVEKLKPLHGLMRRNLAAALQNEPQQAINSLLESDPYEFANWNVYPERYQDYPNYLQRAIDLLGDTHYAVASLKAKKLYFEVALLKRYSNQRELSRERKDSIHFAIKGLLNEAIAYEPEAAYLYFAYSTFYNTSWPPQTDSMIWYGKKALEYSPEWVLPYLEIGYELSRHHDDLNQAEKWILQAYEINPNSFIVLERLAWLRQWQFNTDEALIISRKMIQLKSDIYNGYQTLAKTFAIRAEYDSTLFYTKRSMDFTWDSDSPCDRLGALFGTRRLNEAMNLVDSILKRNFINVEDKNDAIGAAIWGLITFQKYDEALKLMSFFPLDSIGRGAFYWLKGDSLRAKEIWKGINISSLRNNDSCFLKSWLGVIAASEGKLKEAEIYFQASIHPVPDFYWDQDASGVYYLYGLFLVDQNRFEEAKNKFMACNKFRYNHDWRGYYGLALIAAKKGEDDKALDNLEIALKNYYPIPDPILKEPLFEKIRKTKRFKDLMKKHFKQN